jgi:hypothetical protein
VEERVVDDGWKARKLPLREKRSKEEVRHEGSSRHPLSLPSSYLNVYLSRAPSITTPPLEGDAQLPERRSLCRTLAAHGPRLVALLSECSSPPLSALCGLKLTLGLILAGNHVPRGELVCRRSSRRPASAGKLPSRSRCSGRLARVSLGPSVRSSPPSIHPAF